MPGASQITAAKPIADVYRASVFDPLKRRPVVAFLARLIFFAVVLGLVDFLTRKHIEPWHALSRILITAFIWSAGLGVTDRMMRGKWEAEIHRDRMVLRRKNLFNNQEEIIYPADVRTVEEVPSESNADGLLVKYGAWQGKFFVPADSYDYSAIRARLTEWHTTSGSTA